MFRRRWYGDRFDPLIGCAAYGAVDSSMLSTPELPLRGDVYTLTYTIRLTPPLLGVDVRAQSVQQPLFCCAYDGRTSLHCCFPDMSRLLYSLETPLPSSPVITSTMAPHIMRSRAAHAWVHTAQLNDRRVPRPVAALGFHFMKWSPRCALLWPRFFRLSAGGIGPDCLGLFSTSVHRHPPGLPLLFPVSTRTC